MKTIQERISAVIATHHCMPEEAVRADSLLNSPAPGFQGDSLDSVEIVMRLEDEFGVDIPDEHADKLQTVQQMADYLAPLVPA